MPGLDEREFAIQRRCAQRWRNISRGLTSLQAGIPKPIQRIAHGRVRDSIAAEWSMRAEHIENTCQSRVRHIPARGYPPGTL